MKRWRVVSDGTPFNTFLMDENGIRSTLPISRVRFDLDANKQGGWVTAEVEILLTGGFDVPAEIVNQNEGSSE